MNLINKHMQVYYTIIDGEHEYGDSFSFQSDGTEDEEFAYSELAEFYGSDDEEVQEILEALEEGGQAMIGSRAIKDIRVEKVNPIIITVRGGVVQDISNIPTNVTVRVQDYDIDNLTEQELQSETEPDEHGECCVISLWNG